MNKKNLRLLSIVTALMLNLAFVPVFAASITTVSDTMSRQKVSELSDHTIKFRVATAVNASTDTITVVFPAGFTIGSVAFGDIDFSHGASTGLETNETLGATPGAGVWGAAFSSQTLTLTAPTDAGATEVTANDYVVIKIGDNATGGASNNQIANPGTTGSKIFTIGGTFGDTGSFATYILTDEQVVLTATVDPSITFTFTAGNTSAFGTLAPNVVDTASTVITFDIGTNGNGGYSVSVRDAGSGVNPGLYSASASSLIGSADGSYSATGDLSSLPVGYGLQAACTAGCTTGTHIASDFRQAANTVGGLTLTDKNLVTYASATASDHTISNTYKAKVSASTKAGSYTDTLTYIATATY